MNLEFQRQVEERCTIGSLEKKSGLLSEECIFKKCCKKYKKVGKRPCRKCPKF